MGQQTALYAKHLEAGARIVDFGGWDMPIQYQSLIEEHTAVRQQAGVFDVSHMTIVDIEGADAEPWLRHLLANDVARLKATGDALYTGMLNDAGGVIDDLIVYRMNAGFRLVVNCATRKKDLAWMQSQQAGYTVTLTERPALAILAVQGPKAIDIVAQIINQRFSDEDSSRVSGLKNFAGVELEQWFVARTGYTGENGVEIMLPNLEAPQIWDQLLAAGVKPIGLGARDTLRLEAGMNLYGHDMDENISPLSANMAWTIAWEPAERDFIGRQALTEQRNAADALPVLKGLVMEERGVLREGLRVECTMSDGSTQDGVITSGTFSPTLKHGIALARIPADTEQCAVDIRGKLVPVRVVKPGFVRHGKKIFS
ncbi:glycine cleavage system protein T [Pseudohongiella acticola]|uniref:Aminomethyltransferase n=1 Tax=Pseudohongiella acticola TaxID=1524254 RepID=A0A1E8CKM6_9GAMM|nr:glycine cleavage system aminomethyltransferase GcvT [Pseudohongiella acticola]OFE12953.1 glycine cleavage system protein T [Pseudohongiella acticola]